MYERFLELLRENNMSVACFCRETGLSKSTISEWGKGKFQLKDSKRKVIANFFGVSLAWLDGETDDRNPQPVYEVSAGTGRVNGDYADKFIEIEKEETMEFSWCEIHGDSMYPILMDGDMVKVKLQTETLPRDLSIVKINGEEATCKYIEITDTGVWLRAENKDVYKDRFFTIKEVLTLPVSVIGKVVQSQRNF